VPAPPPDPDEPRAFARRILSGPVRVTLLVLAIAGLAACRPPPPRAPALAPLPAEAYAAYLRGRTALYEGDAADALAELDAAAAIAPDEGGIAIARAEALYRLDRRVVAGEAIGAATRRWPRSPEVWLAAGRIQRGAGEARRAIAAFERAIELDRALADAYLGLASTHTLANDPRRAEDALRRLVAAVPDSAEGHHRLAALLLARGDDVAAEPHLRRVLALAAGQIDDRLALAAVAYRGGRLREAIALAREATARSGDELDVARELVAYLLEAGDRHGAVAILDGYDRAVPVPQQVAAAWLLLGLGELDRARTMAEAAAERGAAVDLLRARIALADGDLAAARAAAERVAADDADAAAAQVVAIEALLAGGDVALARARADAALARAPEDVRLLAAAAEAQRRGGDTAGARARFEAAARARPHDRALAMAWIDHEGRAGHPRDALVLAERLLAAQPDDPAAHNLAGYALVLAGGDRQAARALLVRARAHTPGDPAVLDSLGWLLRADGDLAGAARELERAVRIAPLDAAIVVHAATVAVERGDRAGAAELLATVPVTASPELRQAAAALADRVGRPPAGLAGLSAVAPSCYARVRMRTPSLIRLVAGTALALAACSKTPSKAQCEELLTHLIDLEAAAGGAGGKVPDELKAEVEKQKKAIREYAINQKFMDTCTHKTPKKVVECGIAAKTYEDVAACDKK
jgi:tetratricopeptide (TPR) repeat protein